LLSRLRVLLSTWNKLSQPSEGSFSDPVSHQRADQPFGSWCLGTTPLLAGLRTSTTLFPPSSSLKTLHPRLIFCPFPLPGITSCMLTCIWLLHPPPPPVTVALCSSGKSSSQASVVLKAVAPLSADDSFASPRSLSSAFVRISLLRLLFQSAS
jgi:hypothetical protein